MAGMHGDYVAKTVRHALKAVSTAHWTALQVGSSPLQGRRHIRLQTRAAAAATLALEYVDVNADGTWTTPTGLAGNNPHMPGNSTIIEPIADNITVYGRVVLREGQTSFPGGVVVTEYA